ncbi:pirin family protein [Egicoccus halophilus]|uniref:Putative quercetin 2,3-dioxygenase n=1 Tax=Egicoccus halophilus TaxID=1670830 RepID=A0A8J3AFS6_9ACTN|nr:pirin family protein [Egicoccus halophilus]GGI08256.1 putative quercetin 2,3-dioxygenase [Egicoccus halophilus]
MSGPVTDAEAPTDVADGSSPEPACVEVSDSREAQVGRFRVRRALPRRGRRTVGAWCFADHLGPADVTENSGLDVGPHPHIGLQTVTWLLDGQVLHRDSLGSEQVIKPGQLNLMTSGGGVTHAEEATGQYRGTLEGIQLWVALPEATRHGASAFEHHAELPQSELDGAVATVLVGDFAGLSSPARHDTPLAGVDLTLHGDTTVPLRPAWEYALVVLEGGVAINGERLAPGTFGYLGEGRDELRLEVRERTQALLLGGEPFSEPIVMWWNFVGRSREEIDAAYTSWQRRDDRFGRLDSPLPRIPAEAPWWHRA